MTPVISQMWRLDFVRRFRKPFRIPIICRRTTTIRGATTIYGGKINLILHFHFPLLVYFIILFMIISYSYFIINYLINLLLFMFVIYFNYYFVFCLIFPFWHFCSLSPWLCTFTADALSRIPSSITTSIIYSPFPSILFNLSPPFPAASHHNHSSYHTFLCFLSSHGTCKTTDQLTTISQITQSSHVTVAKPIQSLHHPSFTNWKPWNPCSFSSSQLQKLTPP